MIYLICRLKDVYFIINNHENPLIVSIKV
jgi:hypothetical protein